MIEIIKRTTLTPEEIFTRVSTRVDVSAAVAEILEDVRARGDAALFDYCEKFDHVSLTALEVTQAEKDRAMEAVDGAFLDILREAAANIRAFHSQQVRTSFILTDRPGVVMGQKIIPIEKVGLYVPGGTAGYPSSVLMNVIPAQVAEVGEIVMATPPGRTGRPDPNILAAALVAGVDRVFLMGGAQAAAALAYGTETVPKVDKIVGPGNIFVATAKKQLYGVVDIDMIAGPSEILIVADSSADPEYLAADLMSQAEHDPMASAILITNDGDLAARTVDALYRQLETLSRKEIIQTSLDRYGGIIVCDTMDEAVDFANDLAPEHLEVSVNNPFDYLGRLDNAGSVFLGHYSPEPLGDYFAGANHVLPTGGTARFFSPLSVDDFIKKSSFIYYPKEELLKAADDIIRLAETEELTAHANSIRVRKKP